MNPNASAILKVLLFFELLANSLTVCRGTFYESKMKRKLQTSNKVSDVGQVTYFEGKCPDNWEEYKRVACRMIIAEGSAIDSRGESKTCTLDSMGGEFQHVLIEAELPAHSHSITANGIHGRDYAYANEYYSSWGENFYDYRSKYDERTGGGLPHNNVQPYIVLTACIQRKDNLFDLSPFASNEKMLDLVKNSDFSIYSSDLGSTKTNYALKTDIDLSKYLESKDFLPDYYARVSDYVLTSNLSDSVTDLNSIKSTYIKNKEIPNLSPFAKKQDIKDIQTNLTNLAVISSLDTLTKKSDFDKFKKDLEYLSLNYMKKEDIPSMEGYLKKINLPDFDSYIQRENLKSLVTNQSLFDLNNEVQAFRTQIFNRDDLRALNQCATIDGIPNFEKPLSKSDIDLFVSQKRLELLKESIRNISNQIEKDNTRGQINKINQILNTLSSRVNIEFYMIKSELNLEYLENNEFQKAFESLKKKIYAENKTICLIEIILSCVCFSIAIISLIILCCCLYKKRRNSRNHQCS